MKHHGVAVDLLGATIDAIQENPDLARFQFRSRTQWVHGGHAETHIQSFAGAGQEDSSRPVPFVVRSDEPPVLLGTNQGPNAVELYLAALASCLTVGIAYNAAARDITLQTLRIEIEGDIDLHAFLGLSETTRPGYEGIRVRYQAESDASSDQWAALMAHVKKTSPVLDMVRHPVPVTWVQD